MTDTRDQLMYELLNKDLGQWSADEVDRFIVDAHMSLKASMKGELQTSDGVLVEPDMEKWSKYVGGRYLACLAGTLFVNRTGILIQQQGRPSPYYENEDYRGVGMSVLTLLDGLRYLEAEDSSIHELLLSLGYAVPPVNEDAEGDEHHDVHEVVGRLYRFINLNPRLTRKLQEHTRTAGGKL